MSFSIHGIRISLALLALCGLFFFFNGKPKFILPSRFLNRKRRWLHTVLLGILVISVVLLPLRLAFVSDRQVVTEKNLPIQIILDVSLSMAAEDLQPSRFVAAKESLISLVKWLDGYHISLITFSWKPFVYIPFSSSSSAIAAKLESMNLGDFPPVQEFLWTAIGDALLLGVINLQQFVTYDEYKPGIVILITDGDSNIWFDPLQVTSYYQKMKIPVFVLGVGQENYLIGRDTRNTDVTTDINLTLLQELASKTWGKFYRVIGDQSFEAFFSQISQDIVDQQQQHVQNVLWELNDYLIYLIAVVLLGLFVLKLSLFVQEKH